MKLIAISGSARKGGNTSLLVRALFEPLESAGVSCELVELAGAVMRGCTACMTCKGTDPPRCKYGDDEEVPGGPTLNEIITKMLAADAIVLASPTYFADVSAEMKALMDRSGYAIMNGEGTLTRKVGAAVVACRRGGAIHVFDTMNHFFLIHQMIVVGSSYWNVGYGRAKGEVAGDEEGMRTMRILGENMAWALERLQD
jgi:multimeric flavodoxin WrbA